MKWIREASARVMGFLGRGRADSELREEFEYHLEMQIQENLRAGMSPKEARRQARVAFGSGDWYTERVREERGGLMLEDTFRDIRFGLRNFKKRPVFALAGVLTLTLGIGMTTIMFTLVDAVLLRPLPGSNTKGMVYLQRMSEDGNFEASPTPQLLRTIRDHASSFSRVEAFSTERLNLVLDGEPLRAKGARASVGFFSFMGVRPALGRGFLPEDGTGADVPVVMLSNPFWVERFGGSPNALGETIRIGDVIHQVIGVLPRDFRMDTRQDVSLWIPEGAAGVVPDEGTPVEGALAQLAPGVSLEAARAELDAILRNNPLDQVSTFVMVGKVTTPGELIDPTFKQAILILQIAALFVLVIGCGNLTNLLLAQGETRAREFALRASLGAQRGRLVRQLLTENLVLGILGGVGGVFLTLWALEALPLFLPPGYAGFALHRSVFFLATGLSLLSVFAVGILPAWRGSRRGLVASIKGEASTPRGTRRVGVRQLLVTGQVALAFILLVSAGLLVKSFAGLRWMDPGFQADNLITLRLELPEERYGEAEAQKVFYSRLCEGLDQLMPAEIGVTTIASGLVENLMASFQPLASEGGENQNSEERQIFFRGGVGPRYFETLGIPIIEGRSFTEADEAGGDPVVMINDIVARRYFPAGNAVGSQFRMGEDWFTVVGVFPAIRLPALMPNRIGDLQLFFPFGSGADDRLTIIARVTGDRAAAVDLMRQVIREIDPSLPIIKVALAEDLIAESLSQERSNSLLMALFALTALALGVVGIYGVVAYSVSQRIREMGIRLALGASRGMVVSSVVIGGMKTVLAGLVIGGLGALGLGSTLSSLLFEVQPRDPQVFSGVLLGIAAVALLATWLPARRAAGLAPLESLRSE